MTHPPSFRRASLGLTGAARRVFLADTDLVFVTTVHNILEVQKHLPGLSAKYGLSREKAATNVAALPIEIYSEGTYANHLEEAWRLIAKRDPTDVPLLANTFRPKAKRP